MNRAGFTLVEVLVVIGIISILLGIGTFQFAQFMRKSAAESQTRKLHGDMMELRVRALFEKRSKAVLLSANSYSIYSSSVTSVSPVNTTTLKRSITNNNSAKIVFDSRGMLQFAPSASQTICVAEENDAVIDSIVVAMTRLQIGKRKGGMACNADNIVFK
jgi:prepilin-type N-terminal cleavage/methylation domain-containing protein